MLQDIVQAVLYVVEKPEVVFQPQVVGLGSRGNRLGLLIVRVGAFLLFARPLFLFLFSISLLLVLSIFIRGLLGILVLRRRLVLLLLPLALFSFSFYLLFLIVVFLILVGLVAARLSPLFRSLIRLGFRRIRSSARFLTAFSLAFIIEGRVGLNDLIIVVKLRAVRFAGRILEPVTLLRRQRLQLLLVVVVLLFRFVFEKYLGNSVQLAFLFLFLWRLRRIVFLLRALFLHRIRLLLLLGCRIAILDITRSGQRAHG